MKYRIPQTNVIIDIDDDLCRNERQRQVLAYDIQAHKDKTELTHWARVAQLMGGSETASSARCIKDRINTKLHRAAIRQSANADIMNNMVLRDRDQTIADRKQVFQKWMGTEYSSEPPVRLEGPYRRVVVVSDYHGSVHPKIKEWLLHNTYEICIHAGDILDMWSLHQSRIEGKSLTLQEKETHLDEEIQTMRAWFEHLDENTVAQHIVLMGNHDARLYALFVKMLAPILRTESLLTRMFKTPLELLTEGLGQFELGKREMVWEYPDGNQELAANSQYLYQLGDALVSHMNFTGKQPGAAVSKLWDWVQAYRIPLGLSDIRLCLQAHTHALMLDKNCEAGHVNLVETGCALNAPSLGYGLVYNGNWTPSAVGLVSFDQFLEDGDWKTRLNSVQLHGVN